MTRSTLVLFFMLFASLFVSDSHCVQAQKQGAQETPKHKDMIGLKPTKETIQDYFSKPTSEQPSKESKMQSDYLCAGSKELSFDIWDWTKPCQDLALFEEWAKDLKSLGFNRIEISAPWRLLEPTPEQYDLSFINDRLKICKRHGLGMRIRINSYYAGAPNWYQGDFWMSQDGTVVPMRLPSINDERFWKNYGPMCTALAKRFCGEDIYYNAFIGVHAELKYADWWTYDPSSLALWRKAIKAPRPEWLNEIVGPETPLPERPGIPETTNGAPDTSAESRAFIAFREHTWREAEERFVKAIRQGDSSAKISSPLGESFRRESASMSNLDYWGLSRGADQIVHSYDFFWHHRDAAWMAAAAVSAFRGISSLPVVFEFDGPSLFSTHGYSVPTLLAIGQAAKNAGAGLKLANYSYAEQLPSTFPVIRELAAMWTADAPVAAPLPVSETVLLFVSKWANYSYREPTEWLHDAQFGVYHLLSELKIPVRIICEDNLEEDLSRYRAIFQVFSPPELIPQKALAKLEALSIPRIVDVPCIPEMRAGEASVIAEGDLGKVCVVAKTLGIQPCDLTSQTGFQQFALRTADCSLAAHRPGRVVLGYPIGYVYLHAEDPNAQLGVMLWALNQLRSTPDNKD